MTCPAKLVGILKYMPVGPNLDFISRIDTMLLLVLFTMA